MIRKPRVKICCIKSLEEAHLAIQAGADALGLVGHMPSGPGVISDETIRSIALAVPPTIATFLLTSETQADSIIAHHKTTLTSTIQIVDYVDYEVYEALRDYSAALKIVQVIHVLEQEDIQRAKAIAPYVDGLLLDSGNPKLARKELGGTGKTHDWSISREIVNKLDIPVFLAGGLKAANVQSAIQTVRPFGLDLCSGVRTNGALDPQKLNAFMGEVF